MITLPEYDLLVYVRDNVPRRCDITDEKVLSVLHRDQLVRLAWDDSMNPSKMHITPQGIKAILEFEEQERAAAESDRRYFEEIKRQETNRKKDSKRDWIIGFLTAFVGTIIGAILEQSFDLLFWP